MTFQESISKAIESQRNRLGITATELSKRLGNFTPVLLHA